jgi:hypothetical protein
MVDAGKANGRVATSHFFSHGGGGWSNSAWFAVVASFIWAQLPLNKKIMGGTVFQVYITLFTYPEKGYGRACQGNDRQ